MKKTGIVIIIVGILIAIFNSVNFTTKEKVVDIGEISISADKNHYLDWSPYLGAVIIVIGGGVYLYGSKRQ